MDDYDAASNPAERKTVHTEAETADPPMSEDKTMPGRVKCEEMELLCNYQESRKFYQKLNNSATVSCRELKYAGIRTEAS